MNTTKIAPAKSPSRQHKAALRCARRGWAVFPVHGVKNGLCTCGREDCPDAGKHPRTKNGFKDATKDPNQIALWWMNWPKANIGIATGQVSGLVVLDVDPRNGGQRSLKKLLDGRELPQTPTVGTGGGGLHFYFATSTGLRLKSRRSVLPGLDVKADGGYAIAPGSLHESGRKYLWKFGLTPERVRVASVPQWLAKTLSNDTRRARNRGETAEEPVVEGQRHDFLLRLAGALRRQGASPEDIGAVLSVVNASRCAPPLPQSEVDKIARSTSAWAPGTAGVAEYEEGGAGIFWNRITREGVVPTRLTNFTARIVRDVAEDDGAEVQRTYDITAELFNRRRTFAVPAAQFPAMNWAMERLGPGQSCPQAWA